MTPFLYSSAVLAGLLAISSVANWAQWRASSAAEELCTANLKASFDAGVRQAAESALKKTAKLAELSGLSQEEAARAARARRLAEREAALADEARMAAIANHSCAPGQAFQDAINATARGDQ